MTKTEYSEIWAQTEKAFAYLRRKGCATVGDPVPVVIDGQKVMLVSYRVSGADAQAEKHVRKVYPLAMVVFASAEHVAHEIKTRKAAMDDFRENNA